MPRKKSAPLSETVKKLISPRKKKSTAAATTTQTLQVETAVAQGSKIHELVEQLRRGDLASRSAAATKLGQTGDAQATSALAEALRDPTAELACEAAAALGKINDSSALHALIAVVLNSDGYFHSTVRTVAAEGLGNLFDPRAVEALVTAVRDPICETSLAAIRALGKIGDARARPALEATAANFDGFFLPQTVQAARETLALLQD